MKNIMHYNGHSNAEFGIILTSMPSIPTPEEMGEDITIPGRNGSVWRGYGTYKTMPIAVNLWIPPTTSLTAVRGWLSGEGLLNFDASQLYWGARVSGETHFAPRDFYDGWETTVTFECQPFRYAAETVITLGANPMTINNVYSAYSEPLFEVNATGDFEISVNGVVFGVEGLNGSGTVKIDTTLMETYRGTALINDITYGTYPVLRPGSNTVRYSGAVNSVVLRPRWRTL